MTRIRPTLTAMLMASVVLSSMSLSAVFQAAAQSLDELFPDPVVAQGEGVLVRRGELERAFIAYQSNLAARGRRISEIERTVREAQLLDRLIITQLLVNRTTAEDRAKARELAAENLAVSKESSASDEAFALRLKALGLTEAQYNLQIMEFSLAQAVIERELGSKVAVTGQEIHAFYESGTDAVVRELSEQLTRLAANPRSTGDQLKAIKDRIEEIRRVNLSWFSTPERRKIRHLLLTTVDKSNQQPLPDAEVAAKRRQIEQLLSIARKGEDFDKLISLYSEEDGLEQSHGQVTIARKGRLPELEAAAFSLAVGQISDIVKTVLGFHIVRLDEILPVQRVSEEEAAPRIQELLFEQELQKLMPAYQAELKKEAGVQILDDQYKRVLLDDSNPLQASDLFAPAGIEQDPASQ